MPIRFAAMAAGVSPSAAYQWMAIARGGQNRPIDPDMVTRCERFLAEVEQARAYAVARNVGVVQQAAQGGTWQAAAWWLERQFPEEFARTSRVVVESPESLESQLRELVGHDQAEALMGQARERIEEMRRERLA